MLDNMTKSCKVTIFGEDYSLVTNESHEHVMRAAQMVDASMREIAGKAAIEDKKCAVLAALRIASKVLLLETEIAQGIQKNEQLIEAIDQELRALSRTTS